MSKISLPPAPLPASKVSFGAEVSVAVVIPFYNSGQSIDRCMKSISAQTVQANQVILVDDASTEAHALLAKQCGEHVRNFQYVRLETNSGPAKARNVGWSLSTSKYVSFLDADDYWLPEKLRICLECMETGGLALLGHNTSIGPLKPRSIHDRLSPFQTSYRLGVLDMLLSTSQFAPSTVTVNTSKVSQRFDESLRRSEDYRLWGDMYFQGVDLWRVTDFLSVRDEPHINGSGLSGNAPALLGAHLETIAHFVRAGYINRVVGRFASTFLKFKYRRHMRP